MFTRTASPRDVPNLRYDMMDLDYGTSVALERFGTHGKEVHDVDLCLIIRCRTFGWGVEEPSKER